MRWSPVSPVFLKELRQIANGRQGFVARCLFLVPVTFGCIVFSMHMRRYGGDVSGATLARFLAWGAFIGVLLVTPLLTVGTVAGEREANTLPLLFLTRLRPRQIVQDKALARLLQLGQLLLLGVPMLFVAQMLGGMAADQIVAAVLYIVVCMLLSAAISLWVSVAVRQYTVGLVLAYVVLAAVLLVPMIGALRPYRNLVGMAQGSETALMLSPVLGMAQAFSPGSGGVNWSAALGQVAIAACVYVLAVAMAAMALGRLASGRPSRPLRPGLRAGLQRLPDLLLAICPLTALRPPRPDRNPYLWRQLDMHKNDLHLLVLRVAHVTALVVVLLPVEDMVRRYNLARLHLFLVFTAGLLATILAATALPREAQRGSRDVLLATPIKHTQFLGGIIWGQFALNAWLVLLSFAVYLGPLLRALAGFGMLDDILVTLAIPLVLWGVGVLGERRGWLTATKSLSWARVGRVASQAYAVSMTLAMLAALGVILDRITGGLMPAIWVGVAGLVLLALATLLGVGISLFCRSVPAAALTAVAAYALLAYVAWRWVWMAQHIEPVVFAAIVAVAIVIGLPLTLRLTFNRLVGRQGERP